MWIRKRSNLKKYYLAITLFCIVPPGLLAGYVGGFFYIYDDLIKMTYEYTPSTSHFYPLDEINLSVLADMARTFDIREELYHTTANLSQAVLWYDSGGYYMLPTDNGALHTGEALTATCLRYAVLPNGPDKEQAKRLAEKLFDGLVKLIEIPNGGLGPEYPGIVARFYASPAMLATKNYSWLLSDHYKHFNGTGPYKNWRVRLYTSKDELGGYLMGVAAVWKFLAPHDDYVRYRARLLIGQLVEEFLRNYFQEMNGDGTPDGVHFNPPGNGMWKLLIMKLGILAYPENERYRQLYEYFASREGAIFNAGSLGDENAIYQYYANAFSHHVIFGLFFTEDNPLLLKRILENYENIYGIFRNQRNAYINAVYLAAAKLLNRPPKYNISLIRWDVLDQLWRFHVYGLCPFDTTYGGRNKSLSRSELDPLGINWTLKDDRVEYWREKIDSFPWRIYKPLIDTYFSELLEDRYIWPAVIGMYRPSMFIWNRNPYQIAGGYSKPSGYNIEAPSASYTLPYWILAYYGYLDY